MFGAISLFYSPLVVHLFDRVNIMKNEFQMNGKVWTGKTILSLGKIFPRYWPYRMQYFPQENRIYWQFGITFLVFDRWTVLRWVLRVFLDWCFELQGLHEEIRWQSGCALPHAFPITDFSWQQSQYSLWSLLWRVSSVITLKLKPQLSSLSPQSTCFGS